MKIPLITVAVLLLLAGWYAFYTADQSLEPLPREWLVAPPDRAREEGNGYLYLVGMLAGVGEDPAAIGLALVGEAAASGEDQTYFRTEFREEDLPVPPLALPEHALLCVKGTAGCLEEIRARPDDAEKLLGSNRELLRRYQAFLDHTWYQTTPRRGGRRSAMPYGALTVGNRLHHLAIVQTLAGDEIDDALAMLTGDIHSLRSMMALVDDLNLKMTLGLALVEDYRLLSQLYAEGDFGSRMIATEAQIFAPLTVPERSVELDMRRRFRIHADSVYNFRGRRERRGDVLDPFRWSLRMLHKPNRTLNEIFPRFYRNYRLSVVTPAQYLEELGKPFEDHIRIDSDNFVGSVLNRKAVPNFQAFIGVLHDIDCFITLVRIRLLLPPRAPLGDMDFARLLAAIPLRGPYDDKPPFASADGEGLCLSSQRSRYGGEPICVAL